MIVRNNVELLVEVKPAKKVWGQIWAKSLPKLVCFFFFIFSSLVHKDGDKKDRDKKLIKNCRPISLLNIDTKLISKVFASRLKNLPCLISSDQTAYVKGIFISEGGRLISDVVEMCDKLQIKGFLMTVDIEKAFDSINHCFLIKVLEKYGFEKDFIKWIKILLQNQESCIVNGRTTINYFKT